MIFCFVIFFDWNKIGGVLYWIGGVDYLIMSWQGQVLYEYYAENLYKALKNDPDEEKPEEFKDHVI